MEIRVHVNMFLVYIEMITIPVNTIFLLHTHSEFTDEGVLGNPDMKFYFL